MCGNNKNTKSRRFCIDFAKIGALEFDVDARGHPERAFSLCHQPQQHRSAEHTTPSISRQPEQQTRHTSCITLKAAGAHGPRAPRLSRFFFNRSRRRHRGSIKKKGAHTCLGDWKNRSQSRGREHPLTDVGGV
jgi:hypothetical protein